jgi:CubicO group peptidase (beta-lactamase class C family)
LITASLDDYAAELLKSGMATAFAVALVGERGPPAARTFGDAEPGAPWPIASIGKSFAAVIALQLADEGLLDLHAPVTTYLPWLRLRGVTTHHLLTHTSGLVESSDRAPASNWDVIALDEAMAGFEPGAHRHYSNIGYRVVGVVLEELTGRAYGDLVSERILAPLGMRSSAAVMTHDLRRLLPGGHVPPYDDRPWRREHGLVAAPWVESAEADGCSCCSAEDLALYLRELWTGATLLPPASLTAMKTAQPPLGEDRYGYGLDIHDDGFGHGGDMLGYVSHMRVDAARGTGVVAFANGFGGARLLADAALALHAGQEPPEPGPVEDDPDRPELPCPPKWRGYVGRYRAHNPWLPTFAIAAGEGGLALDVDWLDGSYREPLAPLGDGLFRVGDADWSPERIRFDMEIGGRAQRAVLSGTPYYRAFTGSGS